MIAVDNVLLLRPLVPVTIDGDAGTGGIVTVTILAVTGEARRELTDELVGDTDRGPLVLAFETLHAENTFPALPVRDDVDAVVVVSGGVRSPVATDAPVERLRLQPTPRSLLR